MKLKLLSILAICIGVLPISIAMVWYRLTHTVNFTVTDMLVYPLVLGGGNILLILALNRYLLKLPLSDFNSGEGKWYWDIIVGIALTAIYFILMLVEQATISNILPPTTPPTQEIISMMIGLAQNPILLIVWLGPVVWIGVAMFEEISRTFFLNCLWRLSNNRIWQILSIFSVSIITGILHLYQGTFGIVSITIQGLVIAIYYYKYRRIWPLIISHALYDSIQVIMFVVQVS